MNTENSNRGAAPELIVSQWFNTATPPTLSALRGKVVVIEAFQMLCPGCVSHGLPQAARVRAAFPSSAVEVIGLHTVFEHHDAMTPVSLRAFLHEYRICYPVGVDLHSADGIPQTMRAYGMRGTPTLIVIDRAGTIRGHWFGQVADLTVGALIGDLLGTRNRFARTSAVARDAERAADDCGDACQVVVR